MIVQNDLTGFLKGRPLEYARFLCICQYVTRDTWSRGLPYCVSLLQENNHGVGAAIYVRWGTIAEIWGGVTFDHIYHAVSTRQYTEWQNDFQDDICIFPYGTELTYAEGVE